MTATSTMSRPEFTVVRRLRSLGEQGQQGLVPRQRFRTELRTALLEQTRSDSRARRVAGDTVTS